MMKLPVLNRGDRIPASHYGAITSHVNDLADTGGHARARSPRGPQWFQVIDFTGNLTDVEVDDDTELVRAWCVKLTSPGVTPAPAEEAPEFPSGQASERNREYVYFVCLPEWFHDAVSAEPNIVNWYLFGQPEVIGRRFLAHWSPDRGRWETDWLPNFGFAWKALETTAAPEEAPSNTVTTYKVTECELWLQSYNVSHAGIKILDSAGVRSLGNRPVWEGVWGTCHLEAAGGLAMTGNLSAMRVRGTVQSGGGGGGGLVTLENLQPLDGFLGTGMTTIQARVWTTYFQPATDVVAWAEYNIHSGEWELYASDCAPPEESDVESGASD